jgi:diguanylate cyclase (GGDEF)-like protein
MPRTIYITGAAKADCLRIRDILRRRFRQSVIRVNENSDLVKDGVLVSPSHAGAVADAGTLEKKIQRAEFLLETARILSSPKALDQVLWDVVEKSKEILGDTAFIFLLRDNKPELRCAASTQPEQLPLILEALVNLKSQIKTQLHDVIQSGEALLLADLPTLDLPRELQMLVAQFRFKSVMAIPIRKDEEDEVFGVFITLSSAPKQFAEWQFIVSVELAQEMARSIAHADLIAQLEQKANTDALTGIYNNRFLTEVLAREVARAERHRTPLAMLMMDVDNFKRVNDDYGHVAGNEVLKSLATILQASVRREDFVFRCGGDEFAVVLPDTDVQGGFRVGAHIRSRVEAADLVPSAGLKGAVTVSVGASEYEPSLGVELLMKRADEALYKVKRGRKNNVAIYGAGDAAETS